MRRAANCIALGRDPRRDRRRFQPLFWGTMIAGDDDPLDSSQIHPDFNRLERRGGAQCRDRPGPVRHPSRTRRCRRAARSARIPAAGGDRRRARQRHRRGPSARIVVAHLRREAGNLGARNIGRVGDGEIEAGPDRRGPVADREARRDRRARAPRHCRRRPAPPPRTDRRRRRRHGAARSPVPAGCSPCPCRNRPAATSPAGRAAAPAPLRPASRCPAADRASPPSRRNRGSRTRGGRGCATAARAQRGAIDQSLEALGRRRHRWHAPASRSAWRTERRGMAQQQPRLAQRLLDAGLQAWHLAIAQRRSPTVTRSRRASPPGPPRSAPRRIRRALRRSSPCRSCRASG